MRRLTLLLAVLLALAVPAGALGVVPGDTVTFDGQDWTVMSTWDDYAVVRAKPTPTPTPTPTPAPTLPLLSPIWSGDFTTANTLQYFQLLTPTQGNRVTFPAGQASPLGNPVGRMELRPGDRAGVNSFYPNSVSSDGLNRNQFRGWSYGNHYANAGEDRYLRFALRIDPSTTIGASFSNPWRAIVAWPSVQDGAFSPLKFFLQRELNGGANPTGVDAITLAGDLGVSGANDVTQWRLQSPIKGAWYEFIVHHHFAGDALSGRFEFWLRKPGESVFTRQTFNAGTLNGQQTASIRTLSCSTCTANLRLGDYRNASFTTNDILDYGDVYLGASLESVGG